MPDEILTENTQLEHLKNESKNLNEEVLQIEKSLNREKQMLKSIDENFRHLTVHSQKFESEIILTERIEQLNRQHALENEKNLVIPIDLHKLMVTRDELDKGLSNTGEKMDLVKNKVIRMMEKTYRRISVIN